jgi:hypothetical protein
MEFDGQAFADTREVVDGNKYLNCRFERCEIVYCGGEIPHMIGCTFDACAWHFEDAAGRTLQFMNLLYHGTGAEGRAMIQQTIEMIRQGD